MWTKGLKYLKEQLAVRAFLPRKKNSTFPLFSVKSHPKNAKPTIAPHIEEQEQKGTRTNSYSQDFQFFYFFIFFYGDNTLSTSKKKFGIILSLNFRAHGSS